MSFEQLMGIVEEIKEEQRRFQYEPPTACPQCGEPLRPDPANNVLRCQFDGWIYRGGAKNY